MMSTISIGIQGSNANYSIDVDQMRERLDMMHNRLSREIEEKGGEAPALAKRLAKIESQLERLDRLDGKELDITADRAKMELNRGMDLLREGAQYLKDTADAEGGAMNKLQSWFDHLNGVYRQVDTRG
jgi:hypothetical protein